MIKKYFIPHQANDHRPHFLRKNALIGVVFLVFAVELAFFAYIFISHKKDSYLASVLPGVLVSLTNNNRADGGLGQLQTNPILEQAAQLKANDMAENGYFAHTSPDGKEPWFWLKQAGYAYSYAGENLAVNFVDSNEVTDAWMKSLLHRANIENNNYTEVGIAVASGVYKNKQTLFVVQFFGTPDRVLISKSETNSFITKDKKDASPSLPTKQAVLGVESKVLQKSLAMIDQIKNANTQEPERIVERIATSPRNLSSTVFTGLILLLILALSLAVFVKIKIQHPPMIAGTVSVIILVAGLLYFNEFIMVTQTELPTDMTASTVKTL